MSEYYTVCSQPDEPIKWLFPSKENLALEAEIPENGSDTFAFLFSLFFGHIHMSLEKDFNSELSC